MKKLITLVVILATFTLDAQYRRIDSYSLFGGYSFVKGDFGARNDWNTNLSNTGFEIGGKIYYNLFPYHWTWNGIYHIRTNLEFTFSRGKLEHIGRWTEGENALSPTGQKLLAMHGRPTIFGLGVGVEYSYQDIQYYNFATLYGIYKFNVTPGITLMAVYYKPNLYSDLGDINNPALQPQILHPRFVNKVYNDPGITLGVVFKLMFTYQLYETVHIFLENRATWFLSDKIDGLDVNDEADKYTDWLVSPTIGITYFVW